MTVVFQAAEELLQTNQRKCVIFTMKLNDGSYSFVAFEY